MPDRSKDYPNKAHDPARKVSKADFSNSTGEKNGPPSGQMFTPPPMTWAEERAAEKSQRGIY